MTATARVGISGWRYAPWRGDFYPKGLPQRRELEYASRHLDTIELNGSFYSLQKPEYYEAWRDETPEGFVFAVKGGRFITHLLRLKGVEAALANFFASGMLALGPKLGPFLWQLPERVTFDPEVLDAFLTQLPRTTTDAAALAARHDERVDGRAWPGPDDPVVEAPLRHALEVRSHSYDSPEFFDILRRHGVASVVADTAGKWPQLWEQTADFAYVRLHGESELYTSGYDDAALDRWAERVRGWLAEGRDCYVYFDNDAKVRAPYDAMALAERLGRAESAGA
ncbi:DUF72 domain-containing protein [Salinibacterium sp. SYSU T00001]|uniref:DUF72 domain-containing protein n=1 Tax=Homoserinimonas sedimenticola TaxID=2986805 RepID=UPI002235EB55|nr:DUF72 domain-containing protein [Salinibacterium sedimenticola]MCW4385701.1 DUF72 domain-containing protein [Salinibacterium sedimenticola]